MKEAAALAASRCLGVLRSSPFRHPETFMRECFCSLQVELCPRNDWKAQEALVSLGHVSPSRDWCGVGAGTGEGPGKAGEPARRPRV